MSPLDQAPITAPLDLPYLTRVLRFMAKKCLRSFPQWRLDVEDFVQIGFLGVLSVRPQPHHTTTDILRIQLTAARRQMVSAMRTINDPRAPQRKKQDVLTDDIVRLAERQQCWHAPEEAWATLLDLKALAAQLAPRERAILKGRVDGKSYEAIGRDFGRSQAWVYIHETPFREALNDTAAY